ncbi:MAG: MBG domain-containing protein, partial [Chthoniobacterales bacterium]
AFTATYGTASAVQTFTVAGSNLTANITATAPTGFRVSSDGTTYGSTATFTQSGGSASGTLYVRTSASTATAGDYNNVSVTLTSADATSRTITTPGSGNTVSKKALTVTAQDQSVVFGTSASVVTAAGSVAYTGFENGDTSSVVTGTPTYTTSYTAATAAGTAGVTITPVVSGLSATNYSFTPANGTITVTALNNPSSLSVSKNSSLPMTSVNLSWTKADNRDVLIVRNTSDSWTAPTVGTQYAAGETIGTGTVVYKSSGTSTTDNNLTPGTTYFYRFYSENYGTYSTGATGSSVTLDAVQARNAGGAATPSVTLTNGTTNTIYVGDQARFSFDATGTISSLADTNWGQPRLRLKFNDADLSTGFIGTTNTANSGFTDQTNKTIIATNRFTTNGTWYWAMQMS